MKCGALGCKEAKYFGEGKGGIGENSRSLRTVRTNREPFETVIQNKAYVPALAIQDSHFHV